MTIVTPRWDLEQRGLCRQIKLRKNVVLGVGRANVVGRNY
jgi:hypothetical protein